MYESCFPSWLRTYSKDLAEELARGTVRGNNPHYDAIINLLAASVDIEENIDLFMEKELIPYITTIFKGSSWEHDRYIPCLKIIADMANAKPRAATIFMKELVHESLLDKIDKSLQIYKVHKSLFEENSAISVSQQMKMYRTLA